MAKKVRDTHSTHRPGGQGPTHTKKTSSGTDSSTAAATDSLSTSSEVDIDGAVDAVTMQGTELQIEEQAPAIAKPRRARKATKLKADSLEARSVAENTYVREDLRRIGIISAALVTALLVAWVLLVPLNLAGLY